MSTPHLDTLRRGIIYFVCVHSVEPKKLFLHFNDAEKLTKELAPFLPPQEDECASKYSMRVIQAITGLSIEGLEHEGIFRLQRHRTQTLSGEFL